MGSHACTDSFVVQPPFQLLDAPAAYLGNEARTLLKSLLQREPAHRLGYGPTGSQDVQKHPFFRSMNWKQLREGAILSPFKPTVKEDDSVENFDKIWTDQVRSSSACATTA